MVAEKALDFYMLTLVTLFSVATCSLFVLCVSENKIVNTIAFIVAFIAAIGLGFVIMYMNPV